jgi:hypothetical protein
MWYRLFGWWIRWQACKMASVTVAAWREVPNEGMTPKLWSVTVFFETYMCGGAEGTREEFGPREAVELAAVEMERVA